MFSPDDILNTQVEGSMDTEYVNVPNGEYLAVVSDVKSRQQDAKEAGAPPFTIMDVYWEIDNEDVAKLTGRDKNVVRQSLFLDITDSGGLDFGKGKNVPLGQLRDALNQNSGAWSPNMLLGQVANIRTEQSISNGKTYVNVKGVAKAN